MEKNEPSMGRQLAPSRCPEPLLSENPLSSTGLAMQLDGAFLGTVDAVTRQNLASVIEQHGSARRSLSESLLVDPNTASGNVSLRKQFNNDEDRMSLKMVKSSKDRSPLQLAVALAIREAAEKHSYSVLKSRQEMEKKLTDKVKEMELLIEKLVGFELAQEEVNNLSNIVHSDNVRLEHDVAFLKAVLDDTQKELHSARGVLAGERARAFQLQVEVFHLKQRLQSLENRPPTPRKPFHM